LIFPWDVSKQAAQAGKIIGKEKGRLMIFAFVVLNGMIAFFTVPFFTSLGISWWVPISLQTILVLLIMFTLFRFVIFREGDKLREWNSFSSDSFAKYFYLRNLDSHESIELQKTRISVFQYANGSSVFVLRLRYGSNSEERSNNTKSAMTRLHNWLSKSNLEFTEYTGTEDFSTSYEARYHMDKLSKVPDKRLARAVIDLFNTSLEICENESNVDVKYIRVRTKSNYQRYELDYIISECIRILSSSRTVFRSTEFLDKTELLGFLTDFYGLEGIDIGLMKIRSMDDPDIQNGSIVDIYQLVSEDGKTFTDSEVLNEHIVTARKMQF
jgi:uncharacterized protein (UPF0332 family)